MARGGFSPAGGERSVGLILKNQRGETASRVDDRTCDDGGERDAIPGIERCPLGWNDRVKRDEVGRRRGRAVASAAGAPDVLTSNLRPARSLLAAPARPANR